MKGKLPLPEDLRSHPIAVSITGGGAVSVIVLGLAVFAIVLGLGSWIYGRDRPEETPKPKITITRVDVALVGPSTLNVDMSFEIQTARLGDTVLAKVGSDKALSDLWGASQEILDWQHGIVTFGIQPRSDHGWVRIDIEDGQGNLIAASRPWPFEIR